MDLDVFFASAKSVFENRQQRLGTTFERTIRIGDGYTVLLRFTSEELVRCFMPALEHIEVQAAGPPSLTISVWDSSDQKDKPPYPSWRTSRGYQWIHLLTHDNVRVMPELDPLRLTALNLKTNEALFWISDISKFPWYERCRPFRTILHWWGSPRNLTLLHAAAVGTVNGGTVLVGPGGAGKSTTSLACLGSELKFISDDHCMMGFQSEIPHAYSIYNAAKLNMANNIERLPQLKHCIVNADRLESEKAMMFLQPFFPEFLAASFELTTVMVPKVTSELNTRIVRTDWHEAAKAVIPSTMSELPGAEIEDFYGMLKLIKTLPCYRLELGTDMKQIPLVIAEGLKQSRLSEPLLRAAVTT